MKTRYIKPDDIKTVITEIFTTALHLLTLDGTPEEIDALHVNYATVFSLVSPYVDYIRDTIKRDEHTGVPVIAYSIKGSESRIVSYHNGVEIVFNELIPYRIIEISKSTRKGRTDIRKISKREQEIMLQEISARPTPWYKIRKTKPSSFTNKRMITVKHDRDTVSINVNSYMTYSDIVHEIAESLGMDPVISHIVIYGHIMDNDGFIHIEHFGDLREGQLFISDLNPL